VSLFIVFEGPEGSGKTTQIHLLRDALRARGYSVVCTREPGGTPIGEQIRTLLHDPQNTEMLPITEALLYSASRAQHVAQVIRPALERGQIVVSDRYAASTMAYQGYGHGLELQMLQQITELVTEGLTPDLTIYLDLEVTIGLKRKLKDSQQGQGEWNRMDQLDIAFHRRVREGYLEMARQEPSRWMIVDATQSIQWIHEHILERVESLLQKRSLGVS